MHGVTFLSAARLLILFSFLALLCASCAPVKTGEKKRPVPVLTAPAQVRDVPVQLEVIGSVEAFSTVSVKAQVGGMLMMVSFKEGDFVRKGDLLFTIDERPYQEAYQKAEADVEITRAQIRETEASLRKAQAAVSQEMANLDRALAQEKQARANLERDQAQARNALNGAKRYEYLLEKGFATQEQNDNFKTQVEATRATVRADEHAVANAHAAVTAAKASIENARASVTQSAAMVETATARMRSAQALMESAALHLGYCSIRSPMDGRTGNLLIHEGNIVKANDTGALVVINRINPIYVEFAVPEKHLKEIRRAMAGGRLPVTAAVQDRGGLPERGYVSFIDNRVDRDTGTIRLKGTFANGKRLLWPGQYVTVTTTLGTVRNAVVVPSQAVMEGQKGTYVYVVQAGKTAGFRPVRVGMAVKGETVIVEGLAAGDEVVTEGQMRLAEGMALEIKQPAGKAPPRGGKKP